MRNTSPNISSEPSLLVCECSSREHQIVIQYDGEDNLFYAHIHLVKHSFLKRLVHATKYVFGYRCRYGDFEEFIFKHEHAEVLRKMANVLRMKETDRLFKEASESFNSTMTNLND